MHATHILSVQYYPHPVGNQKSGTAFSVREPSGLHWYYIKYLGIHVAITLSIGPWHTVI